LLILIGLCLLYFFIFFVLNLLIVFFCISTMLLSLLMLFFNKGYKKANRFLAAAIFFIALYSLSLFEIALSNSNYWAALFIASVPSCIFLIGPFSYLYVRTILRDNIRFSKYDYLHFALFGVCFSGSLPFLFSSWAYKLEVVNYMQHVSFDLQKFRVNIFINARFNQGIRPVHLAVYFISQWRLIWKHFYASAKKSNHSAHWLIIKKWLLIYSTLITLIGIGFAIGMLVFLMGHYSAVSIKTIYIIYYISSGCYAILAATLLLFPQILYGLPIVDNTQLNMNLDIKDNDNSKRILSSEVGNTDMLMNIPLPSETDSTLLEYSMSNKEEEGASFAWRQNYSNEYIQEIENKLEDYLALNMPLDSNCNLSSLSRHTEISVHQLSYYFNTIKSISFPDWRNNNRIDYSVALIQSGKMENMTLNGIAQSSGFATQKTFIKAFKVKMGTTPADFIKSSQAKCLLSDDLKLSECLFV